MDGALEMEEVVPSGEKIVFFGGGMEKGIPADGGDISEKDRAGVVYLRRAGVYVKSPDLLAAAQAVFRWVKTSSCT